MPLRPMPTVDPRWNDVATSWETAARAVASPAGDARPTGTPTEEQAYRILRAVHVLAAAGADPVDRIADAFAEREDVADVLSQLQDAWTQLLDHAEEAVEPV